MMMIEALRKVIKRMHYPLEVMLTCVRWSAADPLSLRHIEEMMAEGLGLGALGTKDCIVSIRLRYEGLLHIEACLQICDGLSTIDEFRLADNLACGNGLEVVDLDLYRGANLAGFESRVESCSHTCVGHGVQHSTVDNPMRVQVLRAHDQGERARAGTLAFNLQVNEIGKGMFHSSTPGPNARSGLWPIRSMG